MVKKSKPMNAEQFHEAISQLGMNHIDFGKLVGAHKRTVQKWYSGESAVPRHIAMLVNLMIDTKTPPEGLRP